MSWCVEITKVRLNCLLLMCLLPVSVFAGKVERVIALAPHSVEMLYSIGAGDLLVGTTEYGDYPEAAKKIPRVGGYHGLQIEKILSLDPDLIIAWESGNRKQDLEQLEKLGFTVFYSKTENIEDIPNELLVIGQLIGKEAEAKREAQYFNERFAKLRALHGYKEKVTFFYQLWSEPLKTITKGSWINPILQHCGGDNIFPASGDMHYPQVSMEHVLLHAPQAIIIPSHHGADIGAGDYWSKWPEIPAVKNKQIFYIDGDLLHRFSMRILDGMEKVCEAFDHVRASTSQELIP